MKTIYLIRHCKAQGQEPDAELTAEGVRQSILLSRFLRDKGITRVVASPYLRALKSIEPFSAENNVSLEVDWRLRERVLSSDESPDWVDLLEQTFKDPDLKFEGGESSKEASARGLQVIGELLVSPEESIAVVTHGNLLSLILGNYEKGFGFREWKELSNPDVFELTGDGENAVIKRIWQ
jgi:2,3-bisphosphoglycerate-dependent phosphoglycerate mutase